MGFSDLSYAWRWLREDSFWCPSRLLEDMEVLFRRLAAEASTAQPRAATSHKAEIACFFFGIDTFLMSSNASPHTSVAAETCLGNETRCVLATGSREDTSPKYAARLHVSHVRPMRRPRAVSPPCSSKTSRSLLRERQTVNYYFRVSGPATVDRALPNPRCFRLFSFKEPKTRRFDGACRVGSAAGCQLLGRPSRQTGHVVPGVEVESRKQAIPSRLPDDPDIDRAGGRAAPKIMDTTILDIRPGHGGAGGRRHRRRSHRGDCRLTPAECGVLAGNTAAKCSRPLSRAACGHELRVGSVIPLLVVDRLQLYNPEWNIHDSDLQAIPTLHLPSQLGPVSSSTRIRTAMLSTKRLLLMSLRLKHVGQRRQYFFAKLENKSIC
ncbi:hypothetical protein LX36DRAFT_347223 [Colletotrichum falcatum]|nr:hypothetical protein LX36DRAFT_347223 [Colletotrichum falcatum]